MEGNIISDRVAFFLKDFPPYSFLDYEYLKEIVVQIAVRFVKEGEELFIEGKEGNKCCYILRKGALKLVSNQNEAMELIDQCGPGDTFGVRSILTQAPYVMSAIALEESLVYELPEHIFTNLLNTQAKFANYFAAGYASGQAVVREHKKRASFRDKFEEQRVEYSRSVLCCNPGDSIMKAVKLMSERNVGSVIISDDCKYPIGIFTDTDLRNKVVSKSIDLSSPIEKVMSSPVQVIREGFSYSEVLIKMLRSNVHHLVVTENGTEASPIKGVISDHDVMISQRNHPAALLKTLRKEKDPLKWPQIREKAELVVADYLEKELSVELISNFITEINDTLIRNALEFVLKDYPKLNKNLFCWMSLGSEGREEQLLRTDQDNAIIFLDSEQPEEFRESLLAMAERVNSILVECGFEECPANIMARNPNYCLSLSEWKDRFTNWVNVPEPKAIMNSTIFFDFRGTYGNYHLVEDLEEFLFDLVDDKKNFFGHLAANAMQNPPPLGFFRNFLVERSGKHNDEFDIKKRAMMPLSDAARILSLQHKISFVRNTSERFKKIAELEKRNQSLFLEAARSYKILMGLRAFNGIKNKDSGRFINLDDMQKLEKQILKSTFSPIKELQELMEVRFQTAYFN